MTIPEPVSPRPQPATIAASIIVALEGVVTLVLAAVEVGAILAGDTADLVSALALLVLTIVLGIGILAFAAGILRGRTWGRSGGIVTQVLVFAVGLGASTGPSPHPLVGAWLIVPAIIGFVLIIVAARRSPDRSHEAVADEAPEDSSR
ncbi:histidine kinase [Microbacterium nymphoidis]|uniref:histidine kinase n=1 Tax=Microbacterium nymphoidis TaxID=2898586 RepID=UPI001E45EFD1|nr:histidine kinase [Microbacterium nymphoidis]MCD2499786.1 histidine kinase [Microbacterium nymphoidis]